MSVICPSFVQNTWRSDLCSNCFRCREEHDSSAPCHNSTRYRPQAASLYQSRGLSTNLKWRLSEPIYERVARRDFGSQTLTKASCLLENDEPKSRGILVTADKRRRSRSSVDFAPEEALVIGYGGHDYDSDASPWEMGSDDDGSVDLDLLDDTDDDRRITRVTRNNTEFNSSSVNVNASSVEEEEKGKVIYHEVTQNCINNAKSTPSKTLDRTLDILTYNDIQNKSPEKKLNQYYYPSEQHSFLHGSPEKNSNSPASVKVDNCKRQENSKTVLENEIKRNIIQNGNTRVNENMKYEENGKNLIQNENTRTIVQNGSQRKSNQNDNRSSTQNGNCRVPEKKENRLLKDDFCPLNTKTYSFVSELNKSVTLSSEHSSDSDYSTCRLTAGDSTDSESFQDAEESRIIPCTSFLHGNFPPQQKVLLQQSLSSLESDKKYDAGSSTSGDVSNLSDDSDASESYKSSNVRTPKNSPTDAKRKEVTFSDTLVIDSPTTKNTNRAEISEISVTSKHKTDESNMQHSNINASQIVQNQKSNENIAVTVSSNYKEENEISNLPSPNPPIDMNLKNIISVNGCSPSSKSATISNCHPVVSKTKSSPLRVTFSPEKQEVTRTKSLESIPEKQNKISTETTDYFSKEPSDDDEETITNRQSKLAALALELELARRESNVKTPPETKPQPPEDNYPTIKKGSAISCTSRLNILPDVLQETPTKPKKNRFSLKKLLKRNKDSGTFSPAAKESNPKAWKKQTFDRTLEIVHPMDMYNPPRDGVQRGVR